MATALPLLVFRPLVPLACLWCPCVPRMSLCAQDVPAPAASWQSIPVCSPRMSPPMLLLSEALLCVPMFPHDAPMFPHDVPTFPCDVPLGVAALGSTAACSPQAVPIRVVFPQSTVLRPCVPSGCPHPCSHPAGHCVVSLCPPRMSPAVLLPDKAPLCVPRGSLAHTSQCPRGAGSQPLQLLLPPGSREGQKGLVRQNWEQWDHWELTGRGLCPVPARATQAGVPQVGSPLVGAVPSRGSGWVTRHVPPVSLCQPGVPRGQGLPGQGPAGYISAFLFLISLFSYRSPSSLGMTVLEAFVNGYKQSIGL
ncbi:SH3 domain-containing protein C23A1.17-like [Neopelma chrysocephalum]|uniref:SH3 domain-containing protein C23A1.17-like n=1 Tax=Neopelma chrysocephalum TaxID=114329 RepID=UPI000FCCE45F|nr:SH3 domain-containing protein C23A1.17-like [Neopelma chrysocephalum]